MRFLIVEDDPFKLGQIKREVTGYPAVSEIREASSLQEAMTILADGSFDVVLLDMAIPSHGGDASSTDIYSQPVGGLDILLFLAFNERPERVIVITQYPTVEYDRDHVPLNLLKARLSQDDINNVESVLLFADDELWKHKLSSVVELLS